MPKKKINKRGYKQLGEPKGDEKGRGSVKKSRGPRSQNQLRLVS